MDPVMTAGDGKLRLGYQTQQSPKPGTRSLGELALEMCFAIKAGGLLRGGRH